MRFASTTCAVIAISAAAMLAASHGAECRADPAGPFTGSYMGQVVPALAWGDWSIRIWSSGQIKASYSRHGGNNGAGATWKKGTLTGTISETGVITGNGVVSWSEGWDGWSPESGWAPAGSQEFTFTGTAVAEPDGDLVVTTPPGTPDSTFLWRRK